MLADLALKKLIKDYKFNTVLDIGSGAGEHAKAFADNGKKVTAVDLGVSVYFNQGSPDDRITLLEGNFMDVPVDTYDAIWCSHILEHQRNPGLFLEKVFNALNVDGIFAVTVPPLKHEIVGGHVTLWNAGLLLYNLVLAGFNCRNASVKEYGYNISVIVKKDPIPEHVYKSLHYDWGDIKRLGIYFPSVVSDGFKGQGLSYNWR